MVDIVTVDELARRWSCLPFQVIDKICLLEIRSLITGDVIDSKKEPCLFCTKKDLLGGKEECLIRSQENLGWDLDDYQYGVAENRPLSTLFPAVNICKNFDSLEKKNIYLIDKSKSWYIESETILAYERDRGIILQDESSTDFAVESQTSTKGSTVSFAKKLLEEYPTKKEGTKRIIKLMEKYPTLTTSECGALARRASGTSANSAAADAKWCQRNRPKTK